MHTVFSHLLLLRYAFVCLHGPAQSGSKCSSRYFVFVVISKSYRLLDIRFITS